MRSFYVLLFAVAGVLDAARLAPQVGAATRNPTNASSSSAPIADFGEDFWFGLATAAAHVEKAYPNDPWVAWAQRGHVAAYKSSVAGPDPDLRLKFLEEPEVELDLAAATGVQVFRMGVEWGRLVPAHPIGDEGVQDWEALKRYREIIVMAKERNMKVMLTLFHHSMPLWASAFGGWLEDSTVDHFLAFAKDVANELKDVVDYWVTFNEPHVYVLLSNCAGLWPPGPEKPVSNQLGCLSGALPVVNDTSVGYTRAMGNIELAHIKFYDWAHEALDEPRIGVAHNVAWNEAYSVTDKASVMITESLFKFSFVDQLKSKLDWLGLNYYSKEIIGGSGPMIVPSEEYSESGRTIYPDGLFDVLMQFNERYPQGDPAVAFKSIIITENGISDASDILRPSYIVEHLLAVREAQHRGVPIEGYVHWTISDNWEWADGYCPKFGLVDVDRSDDQFKRTPRKSYDLFKDIVKNGYVTQEQRDNAWELVREAILSHRNRPFCRSKDGKTGLDTPTPRRVVNKDWRFTKGSKADGAEDGCFWTPWVSATDAPALAHTSDGRCEISYHKSRDIGSHCMRSVMLKREKRCPGRAPAIEQKGSVCDGSRKALRGMENNGTHHDVTCTDKKQVCCCDGDGRCGFTRYYERSSGIMYGMFNSYSCPTGLKKSNAEMCEKTISIVREEE